MTTYERNAPEARPEGVEGKAPHLFPVLWEEDLGEVHSLDISAIFELAEMSQKIWDLDINEIAIVRIKFYYSPNGNTYTIDVKVPIYWSRRQIDDYLNHIWAIAEMA